MNMLLKNIVFEKDRRLCNKKRLLRITKSTTLVNNMPHPSLCSGQFSDSLFDGDFSGHFLFSLSSGNLV